MVCPAFPSLVKDGLEGVITKSEFMKEMAAILELKHPSEQYQIDTMCQFWDVCEGESCGVQRT